MEGFFALHRDNLDFTPERGRGDKCSFILVRALARAAGAVS
jgi:hypothetical protein